MKHPAIALQEFLYEQLLSSAELLVSLGGENIFDDVPRSKKPPYIVFASSSHNDWSTGSEEGTEHFAALNIWSKECGRNEALVIAQQVVEQLDVEQAFIDDHLLVNLRHEVTEVDRDEKSGFFIATVNLRAVTEPITQ